MSNNFLQSLSFSNKITNGLFKGDKFGFNFYLYPEPTRGVKEILFESGQKYFRYQNGPQEWIRFAWPGDSSGEGAFLRISPIGNQTSITLSSENIWGIIHLLGKASLRQISGSKFRAIWNVRGNNGAPYRISLYIKGEGRNSILNTLLFNKKSLPKSLFDKSAMEIF